MLEKIKHCDTPSELDEAQVPLIKKKIWTRLLISNLCLIICHF